MSDLLVVLPIVERNYESLNCLSSIRREDSAFGIPPEQVLIVDNTRNPGDLAGGSMDSTSEDRFRTYRDPDGHNLGCARSWNIGAREVVTEGLDYLVILSQSVQFGPVLHTTWREQMDRFWGQNVIEGDGLSFKLIAFHRRVFETVGYLDSNLWPAYFEAADLSYRMRQVGMEGGWTRAWVNAMAQTVASHSHLVDAHPLLDYMREKWGGDKGEETFDRPWGDKPLDYFEEVPIPVLAERYGYGPRGQKWW